MKCRFCNTPLQHTFLDLGASPPSNAYLTEEQCTQPETWFPLRILVCHACWLVQTEDYAGREALFTREYAYFSSISTTWLAHARSYVETMRERFHLGPQHTVVEVASNDGYLLQYFHQANIPCYGIEPTYSTASAARDKGIEIIEEFFGTECARRLASQSRQADLMVANNVLAHVPDINDFLGGFHTLLKPGGFATFEFPHLLQMIRHAQFDTAYHEHYSYLSITALQRIASHNRLHIFDVEPLPTHGGSLRVFMQREGQGTRPETSAVQRIRKEEHDAGLLDLSHYKQFQAVAERVKNGLLAFLLQAKNDGRRVAAYGAAAKGNTLLNFAGIKPDLLPFVSDAAPSKQGRFLPGSRIPVRSPDDLLRDAPDDILILPWNIAAEVRQQLGDRLPPDTRFLIAVPEVREV